MTSRIMASGGRVASCSMASDPLAAKRTLNSPPRVKPSIARMSGSSSTTSTSGASMPSASTPMQGGLMVQTALSGHPSGLAARDGGDDRHGLPIGHRGVEPLQEPDVVVGDEHVHEPAEAAVGIEEPLCEARVDALEALQHVADGGAVDGD